MKSLAAVCLVRLRECRNAGRPVPLQVIEDTIEALGRVVSTDVIRMQRDELIRRAGALLPPASIACKARQLVSEISRLRRLNQPGQEFCLHQPISTPREALQAAMLIAEPPESTRQIMRILQVDCASPE